MSFGSGSIPGYLQRLRNSKIRKDRRQKEFKGGNDYSKVKNVKTDYYFPKLSKYNFKEFKRKLKNEAEQERIKQLKFWFLVLVLPLIIGFIIFNFY